MFVHIVLFWLNEGVSEKEKNALAADGGRLLPRIPGVKHFWLGRPAMIPREVVDNSYDLGICLIFNDRDAHDSYQLHPFHKEFMAGHKKNWKRVQVYDFC